MSLCVHHQLHSALVLASVCIHSTALNVLTFLLPFLLTHPGEGDTAQTRVQQSNPARTTSHHRQQTSQADLQVQTTLGDGPAFQKSLED